MATSSYLASSLGSSPSTLNAALGVKASRTWDRVQWRRQRNRLDTHEVVVTVGTVFVALIELRDVLPESFLALLTDERHLRRLCKSMRLCFSVAFSAIEPLLAAGRADGNLCVQNVLAYRLSASTRRKRRLDAHTTCWSVRDRNSKK